MPNRKTAPPKNLKKVSDMGISKSYLTIIFCREILLSMPNLAEEKCSRLKVQVTVKRLKSEFESGDTKKLLLQFAKLEDYWLNLAWSSK